MTPSNYSHPHIRRASCRALLTGLTLALGAFTHCTSVLAQSADNWPSRPIRFVVPFAAGGATDVVARMVAQKLSERLGQPVVVENKPGAANVLANDFVAKSPADGYTLLFAAAPLALNNALGMKLPYDTFIDFAPISLVASIPALIVVHPGTPYRSINDIVAAAKKDGKGLNYATAGVGSSPHLLGEYLRTKTGAPLTHIAYKGAAPAMQDAMAGTIPMMIDAYIPTGTQVVAGKLRAIAVASERRSAVLPDVPTTAEQGHPELLGSGFYGLLAPGKTPPALIAKLHAAVVDAINKTDVREKLTRQGYEVHASTPAEYTAYLHREIDRWTPIVKASGIKPE